VLIFSEGYAIVPCFRAPVIQRRLYMNATSLPLTYLSDAHSCKNRYAFLGLNW
jgi:hypothetical protein